MKLVQIEAIKPRTGAKTEPQAIKLKKKHYSGLTCLFLLQTFLHYLLLVIVQSMHNKLYVINTCEIHGLWFQNLKVRNCWLVYGSLL